MADALGRMIAFHLIVGEAANCIDYDALFNQPERADDGAWPNPSGSEESLALVLCQ